MPEACGRIDALLGRTVFEVKSDLRREHGDATAQLARYLPERARATGLAYVGVATDGATFRAYEMRGDAISQLGPDFTPNAEQSHAMLEWLEAVTSIQDRMPCEPQRVLLELGRQTIAFERAHRDLAEVWRVARESPEARLKRDLWKRQLQAAYGDEVGDDLLFLQHTYLTIVAKAVATLAFHTALPDDAAALLSGAPFEEEGIYGAVESDFFDWVAMSDAGRALTLRIARHAARFDFGLVDADILKTLYESLIDPAQRHGLGEYYTPDWLAARVIASAVRDALAERVLDPACGSGTFLFHAVRRMIGAAEAAGMTPAAAAERAADLVAGIDVHPVAVIFARATFLLALAPTFAAGRPARLTVPIYFGDSLQWSVERTLNAADLVINVPGDMSAPAEDVERRAPHSLHFPIEAADSPAALDSILDAMQRLAEQGAPKTAFEAWLRTTGPEAARRHAPTLAPTYDALLRLHRAGRDHIWGYVARNLTRPLWLSREDRLADVVVGNPPWVAYRAMSRAVQDRFKVEAKRAGVHVGGAASTANDLCALFFVRAVSLYLKRTGRIAFVMPYAAMSRNPYEKLRRGVFNTPEGFQGPTVRFTEAWALPAEVGPLFPVPACVLFAERATAAQPLPARVRRFEGRLPRRDASAAEAARALSETFFAWPTDDGAAAGSPYRARFVQGATLVPRRLIIVEELPASGRLGPNPAAPRVRGRVTSQDKRPWKSLDPLEGPVEREFLRPVLLGESIAPYRVLSHVMGVVPMADDRDRPLDADAAMVRGHAGLAAWLRAAEGLWNKHSSGRISFAEQLDYYGKLSGQFPMATIRVVFAASGTNPAACVLSEHPAVIEHKLYWGTADSVDEGRFICSIFNSEEARKRVEGWQSMGQWGARDFDMVMFRLPIPLYNPRSALHRDLAGLAAQAESVAAAAPLITGEHFTRARARVRTALAESGVAQQIEDRVAALLGP